MFSSINRKIQLIIGINIVIIISICFGAFYISDILTSEYKLMVDSLFYINNLSDKVFLANKLIDEYIQSSDREKLLEYNRQMEDSFKTIKTIQPMMYSDELYFYAKGLDGMLLTFHEINQDIIKNMDSGQDKVFKLIGENRRVFMNINNTLIKITSVEIAERNANYKIFIRSSNQYKFIFYAIVITAIFIVILLNDMIAKSIFKPVGSLVGASKEISAGNFDIGDLKYKGSVEFEILVSAFNSMKNSIHDMITEIRGKAELEAKIKEQEVEKLQIMNSLKIAELKALQSQINPHFLFNTLNSIGRVAYFKGADDIVELIEAVADMLRYNIRKIDKPVTLTDEINNLKNYVIIQRTRFGDKILFEFDITSEHMDTKVPCLTLQPIVENSIIHGFDPFGNGDVVSIAVRDVEDRFVEVEISDNGVGIEQEIIDSFYKNNDTQYKTGHSTGIGIKNVIARLSYFYKDSNVISFDSEIGGGTSVRIRIPITKGEQSYV